MSLPTFRKVPTARLSYTWDLREDVDPILGAGENLATTVVLDVDGLLISAPVVVDDKVTVFVSGGADDVLYPLTLRYTTSQGRGSDLTYNLYVRETHRPPVGAAPAPDRPPLITTARVPGSIASGAITRNGDGAATAFAVIWPDGQPGAYTSLVLSAAFPGAVDSYQITYGSPVVRTYTQPLITRDPVSGSATLVPPIVVT